MNDVLLGLAYLAAVNPLRTRLGLPEDAVRRVEPRAMLLGATLALGAIAGLAWVSGPFLDLLEITPETFRIAAGAVALVAGLVASARPRPGHEPAPPGWKAALWPIAFPRLLAPEVAALALTTGSKEGVAVTAAAAAAVVLVTAAVAMLRREHLADRVLEWTGRMLAVFLVVAGVFLMIDGIRDV